MTKLDQQLREHYKDYRQSASFGPVQKAVCELIADQRPRISTAFEFGCNVGRNLKCLWSKYGVLGQGIEINQDAVQKRIYDQIRWGDESLLSPFPDQCLDVTFTCSVLCHIDEARGVVEHLERIARCLVVLAETNETPAWNYIAHPYAEWGYSENDSVRSTPGNNCLYRLWTKAIIPA